MRALTGRGYGRRLKENSERELDLYGRRLKEKKRKGRVRKRACGEETPLDGKKVKRIYIRVPFQTSDQVVGS